MESWEALQLHCGARGVRCWVAVNSTLPSPQQGNKGSFLTATNTTTTTTTTATLRCTATALPRTVPLLPQGSWADASAVELQLEVEEVSCDTPLTFLCRRAVARGRGLSVGAVAAVGSQQGRRLLRDGMRWAGRKGYGGGGGVLPKGDSNRKRQHQQQQQQQQGSWLPVMPWQHGRDQGGSDSDSGGGGQLPYDSTAAAAANNLTALIAQNADNGCKWLTLFSMTDLSPHSGGRLLLLNAITSLLALGGSRCYLVAAATRPALSACLSLHLPCYNATHLLLQPPPSDSATANATANGTQPYARWLPYMSGTWTKLLVIGEVLGALPQGVGLHFSDHDVVYLKAIAPSVDSFFADATWWHADISMMAEDAAFFGPEGAHGPLLIDKPFFVANTGVVFIRNTPRSRRLFAQLAAAAPAAMLTSTQQTLLSRMYGKWWVACSSPYLCLMTSQVGDLTAVARHASGWRHPAITCPRCKTAADGVTPTDECWYDDEPDHCAVRHRLYVHAICVRDKVRTLQALGLWFLDRGDPYATNASAFAAAGLPCREGRGNVAQMTIVP